MSLTNDKDKKHEIISQRGKKASITEILKHAMIKFNNI